MADAADLGARLRRLRRETAGRAETASVPTSADTPPPAARPELPLPSALVRRLARTVAPAPTGTTTLGAPRALVCEGAVWARRTVFPAEHVHGRVRLGAVFTSDPEHVAAVAKDERLTAFDARKAVFLDIEATGLSGGSGTYPFLVALGAFARGDDGEHFELWQGFMPSPGDEAALLVHVAQRLAAAGTLVTFFGKSYDRHRLEDKMRHHRIAPPFAALPHLDLFHPLQRLYKGALANGRLVTYERELCGVERTDDLSGAHAPAAWFDFVAGRPHRLEDVFRHNADDVLSLVTLAAHLGAPAAEVASGALAGSRARAVARVAAEAGRGVDACSAFARADELGAELDERHMLLWARAHERAGSEALAAGRRDVAREHHERLAQLAARCGPDGAAAVRKLAGRLERRLASSGPA
jgi:hypothetical protein